MNSSAMRSPTTRMRRLEKRSTSPSSRSLRSASPGRGCTLRAINMRQYPARRGRKIIHDGVGVQARRPGGHGRQLVARRRAFAHENRPRAGRAGSADVEPRVTDDERPRRIEAEVSRRPLNHAAARLSTVAGLHVRLDLALRMMRTIVVGVDAGGAGRHLLRDAAMCFVDEGLGQDAARDARLIDDDDDRHGRAMQRHNPVYRPRKEHDLIEMTEIPDVLDDRAVAIEEDSRKPPWVRSKRHNVRRAAATTAAALTPRS